MRKGNRISPQSAGGHSKMHHIGRTLLLVCVSLVLGLNFYYWNARQLVGNTMPMPFGYGVAVVLSGSMEPVLSVNDLVIIQETQDVQVGDIVVYRSDTELIIHRVIDRDGETLQTQGDANNAADPVIDSSAVKGKLIATIPLVGGVVRLLKTPMGILVVLTAAVILVELSYRREKSQDEAKLEEIKEEIRRLQAEKKP